MTDGQGCPRRERNMNKNEVQKRVLKDGKPLALDAFTWDERTCTFSSEEHGLVIDFSGISGCTFKTGSDCTFKTGSDCTFNTGWDCTFIVNGYKFPVCPMRFDGSKYFMEVSGPGLIRSGCIEKPVEWWQENVRRCAEEHKYTPGQIEEYELYVEMLAKWLEKYGDKIVKEQK